MNGPVMKMRIWLSIVLLAWSAGGAQGPRLTDPEVARKLGISVQQVHSLRAGFNLSNEDLAGMAAIQLQALLWDVSHPGIDKHAEEQNFRALHMMDEHGHIPPAGLINALEHRRHMRTEA